MKRSSEVSQNSTAEKPARISRQLRKIFGRVARKDAEVPPALRGEQDLSFTPDTIQNPIMPKGGRDLATYERLFQFDHSELAGKNVLDLGAGPQAKFAKELDESDNPPNIVVSFSPDFVNTDHAKEVQEAYDKNIVTGVGQALPFKDGSFDYIYALFVFNHLNSNDAWNLIVQEAARVLAPGGIARVGPLVDEMLEGAETSARSNPETMQCLTEHKVTIHQEMLPKEVFSLPPAYYTGDPRYRAPGGVFILKKEGSQTTDSGTS